MLKVVKRKKRRVFPRKQHITEYVHVRVLMITSLVIMVGASLLFTFNQPFRQQVLGSRMVALSFQDGEIIVPVEEGSKAARLVEKKLTPVASEVRTTVQNAHQRVQEMLLEQQAGQELSNVAEGLFRVKTQDNKQEIELKKEGVQATLRIEDDKITVTANLADGTEAALADNAMDVLSKRLAENNIAIDTNKASQFVVKHNAIGAVADFPLTVDANTNTLRVETPSGQTTVVVWPDEAIAHALSRKDIKQITSLSEDVTMTLHSEDGTLVYTLDGVSEKKLFGLFTVSIRKNVTVSAETGAVSLKNASFLAGLLDLFSF